MSAHAPTKPVQPMQRQIPSILDGLHATVRELAAVSMMLVADAELRDTDTIEARRHQKAALLLAGQAMELIGEGEPGGAA